MQSTKNCSCTINLRDPSCKSGPFYCEHTRNVHEQVLGTTVAPKTPLFNEPAREASSRTFQFAHCDEDELEDLFPNALSNTTQLAPIEKKARMMSEEQMKATNRSALEKFEALRIGDQTLTELSIGGYKIDVSRVAQKAMEIIPLPPSKLPIIFNDQELNFYHHFFEGMTRMLGEEHLLQIVSDFSEYSPPEQILISNIERMLSVGHERSDSELTTFLKKVFTTTFDLPKYTGNKYSDEQLEIASNIWGFQYIEQGMRCNEIELRTWITMCYNHYRTLWYNTFKSTGIPHFARKSNSPTALRKINSYPNDGTTQYRNQRSEQVNYQRDSDLRSVKSTRRRHTKSVRNQDAISANQLTKWFANQL